VEFSKPKLVKPIPEGTVKCFFSVTETASGEPDVEFNFENESLKHRIGNTMRGNMYEVSSKTNFMFSSIYILSPQNIAMDQYGA